MFGLSKQTLLILGAAVVVLLLFAFRDDGPAGASTSGDCSFTVDADVLNVREGPGLGATVVDSLTDGDETDARATVRNGFRKLDSQQWAANRYLNPVDGNTCR